VAKGAGRAIQSAKSVSQVSQPVLFGWQGGVKASKIQTFIIKILQLGIFAFFALADGE